LASQGVEQDKIDNMYDYLTHPAFSDKERAILAYAEALTMDAGSISQDVIRAFTAHTTDQERVEVTNVAAAMGLLNRLNDGLRVQLEEPIVFIPGLVGLYDAWSFQLEHFSKRYRCVTFDHRGTGESDKPTRRGAYSTQAIAEDVIGLMDTLGIERAHIVGTSTSGCILQNLALDYPDRVCACIFNNPWVTADQFITRVAITRKRIAETYGPEEYVKVPIVVIPRSGIRRCKPSLKRLIS
jgi:pimeloyl-ACP methyl ester carboxylesterase